MDNNPLRRWLAQLGALLGEIVRWRWAGPAAALVFAACCALGALASLPPDRSLSPSTTGLVVSVERSPTKVTRASVHLSSLGSNKWRLAISLATEPGVADTLVHITVNGGGRLLDCELLEDEGDRLNCVGTRASPDRGASQPSFGAEIALSATTVDPTSDEPTGPLSAVGIFVVEKEPRGLGVSDGPGGISMTLPSFRISPSERASAEVVTTLASPRAGSLVWSGQVPFRVGPSEVEWRTQMLESYEQPTVLSQGIDSGAAFIDQRLAFWAGTFSGLAGGALLAAAELGLNVLRPRGDGSDDTKSGQRQSADTKDG